MIRKSKCTKRPYKDKQHALYALHKIKNEVDGRKKPIRAYECPLCSAWHLTSKLIDDDNERPYTLTLDWSKFLTQ